MKAAALTGYDRFEYIDLPDPEITRPSDVIVRVAGAGVCGSDLHLAEGALADAIGDLEFPFVLGHENGGYVEAVGDGVTTLRPGDPVLLHPQISCGLCRPCRRGDETFCESLRFPGVDGTPGGYAELIKTDVRAAIKLPEGTDPAPLSGVADAGLTAYRAVRKSLAGLPPDGAVAVFGIGGVGNFALQLLRLFSPARIVAVDVDDEHLELAKRLGADQVVAAGVDTAERILAANDGVGIDLAVDCVGNGASTAAAMAALGPGGVLSAVGAGDGEVCCSTLMLTGREVSVVGSLVGTLGELTELVGLALRDRLELIHTFYPLAEAGSAVAALKAGQIQGRAVLRP